MWLLRAIATAAGVGALLAHWVGNCLDELDDALSEYTVEDRVPDVLPDWVDDGSAQW